MTEQTPATEPEAVLKGRFAVYETADGGYHLTYQPDGQTEPQHVDLPGFYVKQAMKMAGGKGGLSKMLKMFGG